MSGSRTDLDGQRLVVPGKPEVWLVFNGERHRIPNPTAYDRLFSEVERLITSVDVDSIKRGEDLDEDVCLVRPEGGHQIFLVTGSGENIRRHHIVSFETLVDFGFDIVKTREVPSILVRALSEGEPLTSAARRG